MSFESTRTPADRAGREMSLEGQMLIAMPTIGDPRFERSVIYICAHSSGGAMGIRINRQSRRVNFPELLVQLEVIDAEDAIRLPPPVVDVQVLRGGPVDRGRGFVLHSPDFFTPSSSLAISDEIALTATVDILRAIAKGEGPKKIGSCAGLRGLGRGSVGRRDPAERLADMPCRRGDHLRCKPRNQVRTGAEKDRRRSFHAVRAGGTSIEHFRAERRPVRVDWTLSRRRRQYGCSFRAFCGARAMHNDSAVCNNHAATAASRRSTGLSTIGMLITAEKTPSAIDNHQTIA